MPQDASTDLQLLGNTPELLYNEATYDRRRGNTISTILASSARTTTQATPITNYNSRGIVVTLDITVASGTGGLTLVIESQDSASGKFVTILAGVANLIVTGTTQYKVYPGLTPAANAVANDIIPRNFRIRVAVGDASSYTYSVGYQLVV